MLKNSLTNNVTTGLANNQRRDCSLTYTLWNQVGVKYPRRSVLNIFGVAIQLERYERL